MTWPEKYLGYKWLTGGRDANTGLDCWGLLRFIYAREFRIDVPEYAATPGALAAPDAVLEGEKASHAWFEIESPTPGDVVALGNLTGFSHVGVYVMIPEPAIIHIAAGRTSTILTLKGMKRQGFSKQKFYRHVDRN